MKLKLVFTAEITEDVGDVAPTKVFTEKQNRDMLESCLRDMVGSSAELIIHECKLTQIMENGA